MTKRRVSRRARKKKPGPHRTEPPIMPTRKIGMLLPGIIVCAAIIAVVVTIWFYKIIRTSQIGRQVLQAEEASAASQNNEPNNLSSGQNLTAEEQDRVLRQEQLEVASRLLADFSNDTNAAFLMGMAYFEQGNVVDAEEYLLKSLEFLPNSSRLYPGKFRYHSAIPKPLL